MLKKYCDINYRGHLLEIEENEYVPGKFNYKGSSRDKILFLVYPYTLEQVINRFRSAVDDILGERIREGDSQLVLTLIYKKYELEIYQSNAQRTYSAFLQSLDFATWSNLGYVSIIKAFIQRVEDRLNGLDDAPIQTIYNYKQHQLVIRKQGLLYTGISCVHGESWRHQSHDWDFLIRWFKSDIGEFSDEEEEPQLVEMAENLGLYEYF